MILGLASLPVVFTYLIFVCAAGWLDVPGVLLIIYVIAFFLSVSVPAVR